MHSVEVWERGNCIYYFHDSDSGTSWSTSCGRSASWSAGRKSDSIMYSWEYYTGSVYPASDHTDFTG